VNAADNVDLNRFYGPTNLDRTHMLALSGAVQFRGGLQLSWLSRIYSALPATLTVPVTCACPAEVFITDLTGDGSGGQPRRRALAPVTPIRAERKPWTSPITSG